MMSKNPYGIPLEPGIIEHDGLSDNESTPLQNEQEYTTSQRTATETKGWNVFRSPPLKVDSGSMESHDCLELTMKIAKVIVCLMVFGIVLFSSVIAQGTILLMTSQLRINRTISYCNRVLGKEKTFITTLPSQERIVWIWCIILAFAVPEIGTLIQSTRICLFKYWERPKVYHFILVGLMETLHVIGLAIMYISILPDLDVIQGAMLTSCVCFVPGLLGLLSRNKRRDDSKRFIFALLDIAALAAQATAFIVWPLLDTANLSLWFIPVALILVSCGWWENYVSVQSSLFFIRSLGRIKEEMKLTKHFTYIFISMWKIILFFFASIVIFYSKGNTVTYLFTMFGSVFRDQNITVNEIQSTVGGGTLPDLTDVLSNGVTATMTTNSTIPLYVLAIQILSAYFAYIFGKFACKILIQQFSYALPVNLTIPVLISLLVAVCAARNKDPCAFHGIIPDYLSFASPILSVLNDFITTEYAWVWALWFLSQTWITLHIWTPKCERLASTEKLFVAPMYNGLMINPSMSLNRNRDDQPEINVMDWTPLETPKSDGDEETIFEQIDNSARPLSAIEKNDRVTKIYACATMWHENKEEMIEFLKSILRLDQDQCARKNAQKFLKIVDPDYYEFETHIFFDDAFEVSDHDENESQVNPFVKLLVDVLDEAASNVHQTRIHVKAPKKYPTPYGGRLVWTLPGNTKMIAHLKDKSKIRHRKRWSQVMYMYYLLGHRIMDLPISVSRKEVIAENTYLLALDGDIDFQPIAVKLLIDLMKKNNTLGAACGRIHPMGSGPMVWYQMFEYAIGHWLQKATEHVIGCVLCSPGCFSLFRAKALMDDNVMNTYTTGATEARHYVQYDQGEDRWLCTLLLQRGYRVEYSAASDAYTHAPEGFNEFYNQRRRWMPSTIANIMDLLTDYKRIIKNNDNISMMYMIYQILLMVGTIVGPGTIFLMLMGACVSAFRMGLMMSLYWNIVPILIFIVVCFTCKSDIQLFVAAVISIIYGLVMMAVIVGICLQMAEDGWLAPSSLFFVLIVGQVIIAGLMHPQELICLPCGIIYYVTIPSMYLLLSIYSITNLNNVTWGTREVKVKKTAAELEQDKKEAEESKDKQKSSLGFLQGGGGNNNDERGTVEFSLAGLFRCIFCTHEKPSEEKMQMLAFAETLEKVTKRLEATERRNDIQGDVSGWRRNSTSRFPQESINPAEVNLGDNEQLNSDSDDTGSQDTEANRKRTFLVSPYWLDDEGLKKGEVDFLSAREEQFWDDLIEEYLYPIDEDKAEKERIAGDLKNLRNTSSFAFFMLNTLLVLTIFIMQLNQDLLHIEWPFGGDYDVSFVEAGMEVHISSEYLQLQPIGLVFVFLFGLVLVIQFIAMLFHRFGTFAHILASTKLQGWFCLGKPEDSSEQTLSSTDAIDMVKHIQRLDSLEEENVTNTRPGRRSTVRNLESSRKKTQKINNNLDDAFRERFFSMSEGTGFPRGMSIRRSSRAMKAFEHRRNTVLAERRKSRMATVGEDNTYEMNKNSADVQRRITRNSQVFVNEMYGRKPSGVVNLAFEPELDSLPGPHSSSQI